MALCQTVVVAPRFSDALAMTATGPNPRIRGMATQSHATMLREISAAGDRGRTGALDVAWEGARASFFFMFGHPTHLTFEAADGRKLDGALALDALVDELPGDFQVAPWRRAMVRDDTLHCSADELMGLLQRDTAVASNGHASNGHAAAVDAATAGAPAKEQPAFGLDDFPELSLGTPLWSEAISKLVNFEDIVSHLRDTLLILTGRGCRAAAFVADGEIVKAVWVTGWGGLLGEDASQTILRSSKGTITAHGLDDPSVATALLLLWPGPQVKDAPEPDHEPSAVEDEPEDEPVNAAPEYDPAAPSTAPGEVPDITDDSESGIWAEDTPTGEPDAEHVFTIASLAPGASPDPTEMELVEARAATEFVAPRVDVDIDSLRVELTEIAVRWLGADDSAPVAGAIAATRPGVDDFVATIAAIAAMEIPGHESAIVRAMAREMNYRASEVLCGV
jgi:hypothetical protein